MVARARIEHRSFYIVNAILVKGSREVAQALAARPDVARIEGNPQIQNDALLLPDTVVDAPAIAAQRQLSQGSLTRMRRTYGPGLPRPGNHVAGADTGQRWTHNALKPHYRGWDGANADHITTGMTRFTTA